MFTVPGSRDIEPPREGQSILAWAIEITRRVNRRIHGPLVSEAFGDILIRDQPLPPLPGMFFVQLTEDLIACGSATATILGVNQAGSPVNIGDTITLTDLFGFVNGSLLAYGRPLTIQSGRTAWVVEIDPTVTGTPIADSFPASTTIPVWQPVAFGELCTSGSSGSGSQSGSGSGSGSGGSGSGSGSGGGTCCNGSCATALCCPTDCSAAPTLKVSVSFPAGYLLTNITTQTLTRVGCAWSYTDAFSSTASVACVNGGWVVSVAGGTSTQWKSDPMHFGSPYPPSGTYICDIYISGVNQGAITVTIGK